MDASKENIIRIIVDTAINAWSAAFEDKHVRQVRNPNGVINNKKKNVFMAELGGDMLFYSALVRSFDSSFGTLLETIGYQIAKNTYKVSATVNSYILPDEVAYIGKLMDKYEEGQMQPRIEDYETFKALDYPDPTSFMTVHNVDNWFYDPVKKIHYIIELKSGGDLDNKKAKSEREAILKTYFMLRHIIAPDEKITIKFATAYNKYGEGNPWHQSNVETFFSRDEFLIGYEYWNFVCDDKDGFGVVIDQYRNSCQAIRDALENIKIKYGL